MATSILCFLILLSFSSSSALASSATLLSAANTLSNSGYLSMSLTLQLVANAGLELASPTATIFAPPDSVFFRSGPPSLPLLQYHISPRRLSVKTLTYLHRGTKIPTLLPNYTLTVTASPALEGYSSINNLQIDANSVLDDGSVIIYGIDQFFNSSFLEVNETPDQIGAPAQSPVTEIPGEPRRPGPESFGSVADLLRSKGCSIMAAFLDAQLIGFNRKTTLTVFAPVDDAVEDYMRNSSDYSLIFREHVVPRLLTWRDLVALDDGTMLPTFEEGFMINVIKTGDVPVLNDIPVAEQDLYQGRFLVIHGLNRLLTSQQQMVTQEDPVGDQDTTTAFTDGYVANVADQISPHDDYH